MKISIGCDHGAIDLKNIVVEHLTKKGYEVADFGTYTTASCDYPEFAEAAARAVASGECDRGILICGTGIGMSMCANKYNGIRAAVCGDTFSARMTRCHNDANVLCIGARVTGSCLATDILDSFLGAEFEGGRHAVRVDMIGEIEKSQK